MLSGRRRATLLLASVALLLLGLLNRPRLPFQRNLKVEEVEGKEEEQGINDSEKLNLRGLFFGTSRTYGSGLENKRFLVYPWLVSSNVTNLAIRGTGPQYPAMCLHSMIGDDARYDFVVFEYYYELFGAEAKLADLAKRVRIRFPDALMIFLMIPLPGHYLHLPSVKKFPALMNERRIPCRPGLYQPITARMLRRATKGTSEKSWKLLEPSAQADHIFKAAAAVNGSVWSPLQPPKDSLKKLRSLALYYFQDANHYSEHGHNQIAIAIRNILKRNNVTASDRVKAWDSFDLCKSWYQDGVDKLEHSRMKMYTWAGGESNKGSLTAGKHALEVNWSSSWIKVTNPTPIHLNFYLYYMAMSPNRAYPSILLKVTQSSDIREGKAEFEARINPTIATPAAQPYQHIIRGMFIGKLSPGVHFVHFTPLEHTRLPFRITGIALTEKGEENSMEGFFE